MNLDNTIADPLSVCRAGGGSSIREIISVAVCNELQKNKEMELLFISAIFICQVVVRELLLVII